MTKVSTRWIPLLALAIIMILALACAQEETGPANNQEVPASGNTTQISVPTTEPEARAEPGPAPTPTPAVEAPIATTIVVRPGGVLDNLQSSATTEQPNPLPQVTAAPAPSQEQEVTTAAPQAMEDSDHIEYILRLLALDLAYDFWFVDLESIAADPGLAPLFQNLVETWSAWNGDWSEELSLTLEDAAFAVSLPTGSVYLGGIADVEGLRETLISKGYQREEIQEVGYWAHPSENRQTFTFLPNNVLLVTGNAARTTTFLEEAACFISNDWCWNPDAWEWYREPQIRESRWDMGSMDDFGSEISNSLVFHFDGFNSNQYTLAKASTTGDLKVKSLQGVPDDGSVSQEEAGALAIITTWTNLSEEITRALMSEDSSIDLSEASIEECTDPQLERSEKTVTATRVCRADSISLKTANFFLRVR